MKTPENKIYLQTIFKYPAKNLHDIFRKSLCRNIPSAYHKFTEHHKNVNEGFFSQMSLVLSFYNGFDVNFRKNTEYDTQTFYEKLFGHFFYVI